MWSIPCCCELLLLTLAVGCVLLLVLRCWLRCCNLATIINIVIDHNNHPPPLLHRGDDNFSPLHHLLINNHHNVLDTILERCHKNNIDINNHNFVSRNGINYHPLHLASQCGHLACQYGHLETMQVH